MRDNDKYVVLIFCFQLVAKGVKGVLFNFWDVYNLDPIMQ